MSALKMVIAPDLRLKKECAEVKDINQEVKDLLDQMVEQMYTQNGIGLAAPQIGQNIRVFVMDCNQSLDEEENHVPGTVYKVINPKITHYSSEKAFYEEGCLSLPGVTYDIERPIAVTLEYTDENNELQLLEATGLLATCIQHELDHLNGVLITDYMGPVKRQMTLKKLKKLKLSVEK